MEVVPTPQGYEENKGKEFEWKPFVKYKKYTKYVCVYKKLISLLLGDSVL